MTENTFNPEATDGDGDGIIQEGTKWERSIDDALVNPVVDEAPAESAAVADVETSEAAVSIEEPAVVKSPEPAEEEPALVPVEDGVIGAGKVKKKAAATKAKQPEAEKTETVALFSSRNLVWQGIGKLVKGYNLVGKDAAEKWLTLDSVREVKPEEVKANLG